MTAYSSRDEVFRALADPSRRRLLDRLNARNGQTLREMCDGLDMTRQSVSQHLAVLEGARLVTSVRRGREKLHYLNAAPVTEIADRWISQYDRPRARALSDLKTALEGAPVDRPQFVYTTYIATTPERLWRGPTDPAFTRQYWGLALESDWATGSAYTVVLDQGGVRLAHPGQVVLEANPYRHLAYTWHTFTPEWATAYGISPDNPAAFAREPRSRVSSDLTPLQGQVKLTVVHDGFDPGSAVPAGISEGWPAILSSLKTLLETDQALPAPAA